MTNLISYEQEISEHIDSVMRDIDLHPFRSSEDWDSLVYICKNKLLGVSELLSAYEYDLSEQDELTSMIFAGSLRQLKDRYLNLELLLSSRAECQYSFFPSYCIDLKLNKIFYDDNGVKTITQTQEKQVLATFEGKASSASFQYEKDEITCDDSQGTTIKGSKPRRSSDMLESPFSPLSFEEVIKEECPIQSIGFEISDNESEPEFEGFSEGSTIKSESRDSLN